MVRLPAGSWHGHFASSSSSPASMSSAKWRSVIVLPPMLTVPSLSSKASVIMLSRNMLKRVGESRHPCRTPTVVRNQSPMLPSKRTALVALSEVFDDLDKVCADVVLLHGCLQSCMMFAKDLTGCFGHCGFEGGNH